MNRMNITVFADPVCTWCWGSVPVLRALSYRYGDQLQISYVMGVMIDNIETFNDRKSGIGGDIALSNRNIHKVWLDASLIHGMPVCESGFRLFTAERRSTEPQNLAYIAASLYAKEKSGSVPESLPLHYLRRLQEATAVDALPTNDEARLVELAAVVGMDTDRFRHLFESHDAVAQLKRDRAHCRDYAVNKFPTYILEYRGEEMMLRGFTTFDILKHSILQLSYNRISPVNDGRELFTAVNVKAFMASYGFAYPVEIATTFGIARKEGHNAINAESYAGLSDIMSELIEQGEVAMAPRGNGFIYYNLKDRAGRSQQLNLHHFATMH